jgi:hypothetical protein
MALTDNQTTTMAAMAEAFRARMEELFPLPEEMSESDKEMIRGNWEKLGQAVAVILAPTMSHIVANAEIGTVISEVVGNQATQVNSGEGLVQ